MLTHHHFDPEMWNWALSTQFGTFVFSMTFITWTLIIVNLFLLMLLLVNKLFGKGGVYVKSKK